MEHLNDNHKRKRKYKRKTTINNNCRRSCLWMDIKININYCEANINDEKFF